MIDKLKESFRSLGDRIAEEEWFRELKGKWEELDPQNRLYIKAAAAVGAAGAVLWIVVGSIVGVYTQKSDLADRHELLNLVSDAAEEMRDLKRASSGTGALAGQAPNWKQYFETTAGKAGLEAKNISVTGGKKGRTGSKSEEVLYTINVDSANVRQLTRYAYQLEHGTQPVKLRNLKVETKGNEGYLTGELAVSAYTLKK